MEDSLPTLLRFCNSAPPLDPRTLSAFLEQLRRRFSKTCLSPYVISEMISALDEVISAVSQYGKTLIDPSSICQDFWSHWFTFERILIDLNSDDESPAILKFCHTILTKSHESLKIAEPNFSLNLFSEVYDQISAVLTQISLRRSLPSILHSIGKVLHSLTVAVSPLFVAKKCQRFSYAILCLQVSRSSIGILISMKKAHFQIDQDITDARQLLSVLIPKYIPKQSVPPSVAADPFVLPDPSQQRYKRPQFVQPLSRKFLLIAKPRLEKSRERSNHRNAEYNEECWKCRFSRGLGRIP
jgi:hypothetical protein